MKRIRSILLIDDDPVANFVHEDIIKSLNLADEVKIVNNGTEALNLINEHSELPELILLDLNMPVMDGFEFLEKFRQTYPNTEDNLKIVVLTSSSNSKDIEEAGMLDIDDYLVKPLTDKKFLTLFDDHFIKAHVKPTLNRGLNL